MSESDVEWDLRDALRDAFERAWMNGVPDETLRKAARNIDGADEFTDWLAERDD